MRVEFNPSQVSRGLRCLLKGGIFEPNVPISTKTTEGLVLPHKITGHPSTFVAIRRSHARISYLAETQGDLFKNNVKLVKGKNTDRVVFRQPPVLKIKIDKS